MAMNREKNKSNTKREGLSKSKKKNELEKESYPINTREM